MKFTTRLNKSTNLVEAVAQVEATIESIEVVSKSNSNGKSYGFIHARNDNGLMTGIAYQNTHSAYNGVAEIGDTVMLEALASEVASGVNNHWNLALPSASEVVKADADAASAFLASLK